MIRINPVPHINRKTTISIFLLAAFCFITHSAAPQSAISISEFIFTTAPFKSCHASTIVQLRNGDFLAAWFGGTAEGNPDVAIYASRRTHDGWSVPFQLVREPNTPTWNPVLFHSEDGRLWLYYKFGAGPTTWRASRIFSTDEGATWSQPERLPDGILGPIKDKPLVLDGGTIVSGSSVETLQSWNVWIERSTDNGISWTKVGPVSPPALPKSPFRNPHPTPRIYAGQPPSQISSSPPIPYGIIQPALVPLDGNNHLRLYARSTSNIGSICVADSSDGGVTWTEARAIDIPNPNSGIDAIKLRDGRVILIYNNTRTGRTPLNLAVSADGENFKMFATLESEPGEFSYPAVIQGSDGNLYITYTWNRTRIKYVRIPLSEIPN
jgi:predicted neuraminidase